MVRDTWCVILRDIWCVILRDIWRIKLACDIARNFGVVWCILAWCDSWECFRDWCVVSVPVVD